MRNQVLSIESMQHLKELGVDTSGASLTWMLYPYEEGKQPELSLRKYSTFKEPFRKEHCIPAFTFQDIIELLPEYIPINDEQSYDYEGRLFISKNTCKYLYRDCEGFPLYAGSKEYGNNILESAYNLLCWCAENGYLKGGWK